MQYDALLQLLVDFFEKERVRYAVVGDLAYHLWGHRLVYPHIELLADSFAREAIHVIAVNEGLVCEYESRACATYRSQDETLALSIIYTRSEGLLDAPFTMRVIGDVVARVAPPARLIALNLLVAQNVWRQAGVLSVLAQLPPEYPVFDEAVLAIVRDLKPTAQDIAALEGAVVKLDGDAWLEWNAAVCAVSPPRGIDGPWLQPFEL